MRDNLEVVAMAGVQARLALQIVNVTLADIKVIRRASGELVVVALIRVRTEGHLVGVLAVARGDGLTGDGSKTVVMGFAAIAYAHDAALNFVKVELHGTMMISFHHISPQP